MIVSKMRSGLIMAACVAPMIAASPARAEGPIAKDAIGTAVLHEFLQPSYARVARDAGKLATDMTALCKAPDADKLAAARAQAKTLFLGWARVEFVRFGPVVRKNAFERLYFWPDPRGVGRRKIRQYIKAKDASAMTADGIAGKSVAVQGLGAMEYMLFSDMAEAMTKTPESYACKLGLAIAGNIAALSAKVSAGWADGTQDAQDFTKPSASNAAYRTGNEVANEVLKAMATGVQLVRDAKLASALGKSLARANAKRLPFWRAGISFQTMQSNLDGVLALYEASRIKTYLIDEVDYVDATFKFETKNVHQVLQDMTKLVFEDVVTAEKPRKRLQYGRVAAKSARELIIKEMAMSLGLTVGFNALDGD